MNFGHTVKLTKSLTIKLSNFSCVDINYTGNIFL